MRWTCFEGQVRRACPKNVLLLDRWSNSLATEDGSCCEGLIGFHRLFQYSDSIMMDHRSQLNRTNIRLALIGVALLAATITLTSCSSKVEVWVEAGESIQAAIDRAEPGTIILLTGQLGHPWGENLVIDKSITLRGQGDRSVIDGATSNLDAAILIESTERIVVELEGITVKGGASVIIQIGGSAKATITGCIVSNPGSRDTIGIVITDSAEASISGCFVSKGTVGILLWGSAQATITDSTIQDSYSSGVWLTGSAQATISNCTFSEGNTGILLGDSTQATITNNKILENVHYGIRLYENPLEEDIFTGYVTGKENILSGGGVLPDELEFLRTSEGGELDRRE